MSDGEQTQTDNVRILNFHLNFDQNIFQAVIKNPKNRDIKIEIIEGNEKIANESENIIEVSLQNIFHKIKIYFLFQINHKRSIDMAILFPKNRIETGNNIYSPPVFKKSKPSAILSRNPDNNSVTDIQVGTLPDVSSLTPDLINEEVHEIAARVVDINGIIDFFQKLLNNKILINR